jgi:hypothetical protein
MSATRDGGDVFELIERLARVEHEQWMAWSQSVANEVSPERRRHWRDCWVPYDQLPEERKELDRAWARRALAALRRAEGGPIGDRTATYSASWGCAG